MSLLRVNRIRPRTGTHVDISALTIDGNPVAPLPWVDVTDGENAAAGDGSTPDAENFQAKIEEAEDEAGTLYVPAFTYNIDRPLHISSKVRVLGDHRGVAELVPSFRNGPMVVVAPPAADYPNIRTGAALATGSGPSILFTEDSGVDAWYLSLDDLDSCRIHDWDEIAVECFLHVVEDPIVNGGMVVCSSGRRWTNDPDWASAFFLWAKGSGSGAQGALAVHLETENNTIDMTTAVDTILPNTTYHVEVSYDGANVRLFVDGVEEASAAATGAIVQEIHESFTIGREVLEWPEENFLRGAVKGRIDSFRLSNNARHTSGFTPPTAKHAIDADTVLLLNFDETDGIFLIGRNAANEKMWMVVRNDWPGALITGVELSRLRLGSADRCIPLFATGGVRCLYSHLVLSGGPFGFFRWRENFVSPIEHCTFSTSSRQRAQLANSRNSGASLLLANHFEGSPYELVEAGGASSLCIGNFFSPGSETRAAHILNTGNAAHIIHHWVDHETTTTNWIAPVIASRLGALKLSGGELNGHEKAAVLIDECGPVTMDTTFFNMDAASTGVFSFPSTPLHPVLLVNPTQSPSGGADIVPWSATPQHVRIVRGASVQQAVYDNGNSGTTKTVNAGKGEKQKLTATGNCTVTLTMDEGADLELHYLTGAGSFTATFSSVTWVSGSAPTLTVTAAKRDIFGFTRTDGVTFGRVIGQNL